MRGHHRRHHERHRIASARSGCPRQCRHRDRERHDHASCGQRGHCRDRRRRHAEQPHRTAGQACHVADPIATIGGRRHRSPGRPPPAPRPKPHASPRRSIAARRRVVGDARRRRRRAGHPDSLASEPLPGPTSRSRSRRGNGATMIGCSGAVRSACRRGHCSMCCHRRRRWESAACRTATPARRPSSRSKRSTCRPSPACRDARRPSRPIAQALVGVMGVTLGQYGTVAVDPSRLDPARRCDRHPSRPVRRVPHVPRSRRASAATPGRSPGTSRDRSA